MLRTQVDNFIGFPVGDSVPVGWYNPSTATWNAWNDGRVIGILDTRCSSFFDLTKFENSETVLKINKINKL